MESSVMRMKRNDWRLPAFGARMAALRSFSMFCQERDLSLKDFAENRASMADSVSMEKI